MCTSGQPHHATAKEKLDGGSSSHSAILPSAQSPSKGGKLPSLQVVHTSGSLSNPSTSGHLPPISNGADRRPGDEKGDGASEDSKAMPMPMAEAKVTDGESKAQTAVESSCAKQHQLLAKESGHHKNLLHSSAKGVPSSGSGTAAGSWDVPPNRMTRRTSQLKAAAMAVTTVKRVKNYRRSSAALHTDLLRAFVPDVLINVSVTLSLANLFRHLRGLITRSFPLSFKCLISCYSSARTRCLCVL